jgi:diaminopropionate ammonia-lyase
MDRVRFSAGNARAMQAPPPPPGPRRFHRGLPGYAPTPLVEAPGLARRLGLGRLWVKDEAARFGLPAFKILGASWAVACALAERAGLDPDAEPLDLERLRGLAACRGPLRITAATDGNHGRGLARVARWLGVPARIFVPAGTVPARITAIAAEGAEVIEVPGTYDATVERAAAEGEAGALLVQDHAWPGQEALPRRVIEGYATLFDEIEEALAARGEPDPAAVLIQVGVGALAAAGVHHWRRAGLAAERRPALICVEPTAAACVLASVEAGRIVTVAAGAEASIMAGLNCGTPSSVAWPALAGGMDAFVAVGDERAEEAVRALAADGIASGESGAAGVAGLLALCAGPDATAARARLGLAGGATALVLSTEGPTDPAAWTRIVGRPPPVGIR